MWLRKPRKFGTKTPRTDAAVSSACEYSGQARPTTDIPGEASPTPDRTRNPKIRLALRLWAALYRRQRALAPAAAAFEAALPGRIRGDERFQQALEDADTADALQQAMAVHDGVTRDWAAKAVGLLRAIETADDAYERELRGALDSYRDALTGDSEENGTNGMHSH